MFAQMKNWLASPKFKEEDQTNAAMLLNFITLSSMIAIIAYSVLSIVTNHSSYLSVSLLGFLLVVCMLAQILMRRGDVLAASLSFLIPLWLVITFTALFSGGITAPAHVVYLTVISMAALLLGVRWGLIFTFISILASLVMVWLQTAEYLPDPLLTYTTFSALAVDSINAFMVLFVVLLSVQNLRLALKRTRQELSERERVEKERLAIESRFRALVEQVPAIVYTAEFGKNGRWLYVSPQIEKLIGYSSDEWQADLELWYKQLHPEDRERVVREELASHESSESLRSEYRLLAKDGHEVWFLDEAAVITNSTGQPVFLQGVMYDITDRKMIEERLIQSEKKYRQLADLLPQIVFEADIAGRITFANQTAFTVFGYTREDFDIGLNALQMIVPEQRQRGLLNLQGILRGESSQDHEYTAMTKEGHTFPVLIFTAPIVEGRDTVGLRGVLIDITDRKRVEEESKQSEERFRNTFDNAPIGMAIVGLDDHILQANRALADILGYPREQLVGKTVAEITYPEDRAKGGINEDMSLERQTESFTIERRYIRGDGEIVWGQFSVSLVLDANSNPGYYLGQMQDITRRKEAEDFLRASETRFRALTENSTDVISVLDTNGIVIYTSPSTQKIMGYIPEDFLATDFFDKVHPDDLGWTKALLSQVILSPGKNIVAEFRFRHQDASWRWVELTATNAVTEPGILGIIANYRDITDNRNSKDAMQTRAARQSILAQIGQTALVEVDLSVLMMKIVDLVAETFAVEFCKILELMPDGRSLLLRTGIGWKSGSVGTVTMDVGQNSQAGYTLLSRTPVIVEDLRSERRFLGPEFLFEHGVVSGMSVVIEGRDRPYGVLGVHSAHHRVFGQEDVYYLQAIANVLGAAVGRFQADEALRNSEERYMLAATGANDGLWDWDLRSNEIYYSPRWKEMLGFADHELQNNIEEWLQRVHPIDEDRVRHAISPNLNLGTSRFEIEYRIRHKDDSYHWVLNRGVVVRDSFGTAYRMAGSLSDITERKMAEKQLQFDAFHDPLTGLSNRAYLNERLAHVTKFAERRSAYRFAVLFLDLDEFKVVNDRFGHNVGDKLLIEVARRLETHTRSVDTLARLGGDEFVILLEDITGLRDATQVAERVQGSLADMFDLADVKVATSASIGIVCNDLRYQKPEEVLRDADIAMYSAKASGKAHYQVFSLTLREQTIHRLEREADLRLALERNQFRLYYQPIYSLLSKVPIGVEALLRWRHPTQGLIMPRDFIKIAEDSNLIVPIDCFVLYEACLQIRRWEKLYRGVSSWIVHVNLSSRHFVQPNLAETIHKIIKDADFDPTRVYLEITESAIMENVDIAMIATRQLHDLGIQIGVDDFGTGYSSLNYLTRFPVDVLKLDQSFVPRILTDRNTREIINTVLKLAQKLGIKVIAEGIETEEQLSELLALGCEFGQGYLFSKPVDKDAMTRMASDSS